MKNLNIILGVALLCFGISAKGQVLNFAFRSNNQQILEDALKGAFVTIVQSYELCDSTTNERFGREGKSYFSRIPFLGIETTKGLIIEKEALTPWHVDEDFQKYEGKYVPVLTESSFEAIHSETSKRLNPPALFSLENTKELNGFLCFNDSIEQNLGIEVDAIAGLKKGWIIWLTSTNDNQNDGIKLNPIRKDLEISEDGIPIQIDTPSGEDDIIGGIYVVPTQTKIGQVTLLISGILSYSDNDWKINFPFLSSLKKDEKPLTPVKRRDGLNELPKLPKL